MFRSLILLIAVGLLVWLVSGMLKKHLADRSRRDNKPARQSDTEIKTIVQCAQCQAFIPEDKAVTQDGKTFCSQQHLEDWNHNE